MHLIADLRIPMRDAVSLAANVWLPDTNGAYGAVVLRTPYRNDASEFDRYGLAAYVEAGYAVVFQNVRGRGYSDGEFGFFFVEGEDGYDTVEWIAAQPWCNGRVAMDGGSYLGTVQFLAAREQPPHLVCILPAVAAGDYFNEVPYTGGALQIDAVFSSFGGLAGATDDPWADGARNPDRFRPLRNAEAVLGYRLPFYQDILDHPVMDTWWRRIQFGPNDFQKIDVPAFAVTGWFDGDQAGLMHYWTGIEEYAPSVHEKSHLVVGPWMHAQCYLGGDSKCGELDFGADSILDLRALRIAFLNQHMCGAPGTDEPRVRLFITGSNRWRTFARYPPPGTTDVWFLGGAGQLLKSPAECQPDTYDYDPCKPMPYRPGGSDVQDLCSRPDVLTYTSMPLDEPLTVAGPVELDLYAASSAPDTDFVARLVDLQPDGRAVNLTHAGGLLRMRYCNGYEMPELVDPGNTVRLRIRLNHVGHTFQTGHRLRLLLSSSCFPMAEPNLNTGGDFRTETTGQVARQQIFHDSRRPSRLLLPVFTELPASLRR